MPEVQNAATFGWLCVETNTISCSTRRFKQPPSGGCVLKQSPYPSCLALSKQPPSGGCVLKHLLSAPKQEIQTQPPSGGCVLKQAVANGDYSSARQPPSGGCVLKHGIHWAGVLQNYAATFGWLCVETTFCKKSSCPILAATFGWLCVETL